jgi:hypothetical protein
MAAENFFHLLSEPFARDTPLKFDREKAVIFSRKNMNGDVRPALEATGIAENGLDFLAWLFGAGAQHILRHVHCGGVRDGRFPLPIGRSMEYRGVEYTVVRDERGDWQWAVSLGNPETIKSGHATGKGAAVLKVWAAIDRKHRKVSLQPRPNVSGNEVPP